MRSCTRKSSAFFLALASAWLAASPAAPSSPCLTMSSSTCISSSRQCIVEIIMTSAFSTSHLRARRNRSSSASGWSCLSMLQKAVRSSSGGVLAIAALKSWFWPNLSSSADSDRLLMSGVAPGVVAGSALSASALSPLLRRNTFSLLFFLSFLPSLSCSSAAGAAAGAASTSAAAAVASAGDSTPKTFMVKAHSSRSFSSSWGVRVPGRPAGVFGAMTR
jgi:hypothetical protein